ncbi:hypothetical protein WMY93_032341 [Mugilogobius chulae]|uniref:Uncharacterized protein n=1 Tax=Mugilogobius chulae TaxID=88201 RepID=A0AAW0MPE1_9GOBI
MDPISTLVALDSLLYSRRHRCARRGLRAARGALSRGSCLDLDHASTTTALLRVLRTLRTPGRRTTLTRVHTRSALPHSSLHSRPHSARQTDPHLPLANPATPPTRLALRPTLPPTHSNRHSSFHSHTLHHYTALPQHDSPPLPTPQHSPPTTPTPPPPLPPPPTLALHTSSTSPALTLQLYSTHPRTRHSNRYAPTASPPTSYSTTSRDYALIHSTALTPPTHHVSITSPPQHAHPHPYSTHSTPLSHYSIHPPHTLLPPDSPLTSSQSSTHRLRHHPTVHPTHDRLPPIHITHTTALILHPNSRSPPSSPPPPRSRPPTLTPDASH